MDIHRKTNRLRGYDYSLSGFYYITICVDNKLKIFGKIVNGISLLNNYGRLIETHLMKIPINYLFIKIDKYIIMPDHVHIIFAVREYPQKTFRSSISNIIGSFKSTTSRKIHQCGKKNFHWQRSFHDRILRDTKELYFAREYIELNPLRWELKNKIEFL